MSGMEKNRSGLVKEFSRRSWLQALGAATAAAGLLPAAGTAQVMPRAKLSGGLGSGRKLDPEAGLSVALLGTGNPLPNPERAGASALVVAGARVVLVDAGRGMVNRMFGAGFINADLALFTHFHSDHFGEFGEFMVTRTIRGADRAIPVIGPEGTKKTIGGLLEAYSLDNTYRKAHHGDKWSDQGMQARITESAPAVVFDEGGLRITMFEVDHTPVKPAVGYRFDFKGKSVVISGDTKKVPRMVEMAKGCDVLVHEAINKSMIQKGQNLGADMDERLKQMSVEMMEYHTDTIEVAEIARDAGVKQLVLTHLVPGIPANPAMERLFTQGMEKVYPGPIKVGRDRMEIAA